jgi:hypothetical protein
MMSQQIDWDKIHHFMNLIRKNDEDATCELRILDSESESESAHLVCAYPLNDEFPLRWLLEVNSQGVRSRLAHGTKNEILEYVILGCPTSIISCRLLATSLVEDGIRILAAKGKLNSPWHWIPF